MTENRIFTLCRMITWVVFLRMFWNLISSLAVKRGGSLSFLVRTISNVLVMEIGWTDVGSGGYILVSCAHSITSFKFLLQCISYYINLYLATSCLMWPYFNLPLKVHIRHVWLYYQYFTKKWLKIKINDSKYLLSTVYMCLLSTVYMCLFFF